jgi:nuclear transport factor 2 (NTF2) superfamily protein
MESKLNIYYVAAKETMQGLLTQDNGLWWRNYGGTNLAFKGRMSLIRQIIENIKIALNDGWVITFPQGTTKSFKPVRKGQHI